jgi:hypothetical protein
MLGIPLGDVDYDSRGSSFEVVIVRREPGRVKFGKWYPEHQIYPTASQWGTYAWSFGPKDMEIALSTVSSPTW